MNKDIRNLNRLLISWSVTQSHYTSGKRSLFFRGYDEGTELTTGRNRPVFRGSVKSIYFNETACSFFRYFVKFGMILTEQSRNVFRDHVKRTEFNTTIVPLFRCGPISQRNHYIHLLALPPILCPAITKKAASIGSLNF